MTARPPLANRLKDSTRTAVQELRRSGRSLAATSRTAAARLRWDARAVLGVQTVPESAWPSDGADTLDARAPLYRRVLPLPPALGLSRWLFGRTTAGLDAFDRSADRLGLWASSAPGAAARGAVDPAGLAPLLKTFARHRPRDRSPHLVVVTDPGDEPAVRSALRTVGVLADALIVPDPGPARRAALLSLVSVVAIPASTASGFATEDPAGASDWEHEARAAGVMTVPVEPGAALPWPYGTPDTRRDAGRAARASVLRACRAPDDGPQSGDGAEPARGRAPDDGPVRDDGPAPAGVLTRPGPRRVQVGLEPRRVVVAGHDLKFAGGLIATLRAGGHEVRVDGWVGHARHNAEASRSAAGWADAVFCEWTLGNAVWYSRHAPEGTRLTARLHLQELATAFPARVRTDRVDSLVCVAEHVRAQVVRDHGWSARRTEVVHNAVALPDRPVGDPANRHRLGLVGMVPARKGLHAALDLLEALRRQDPRFTLSLRGRTPGQCAWLRERADENEYFTGQLGRLRTDPVLSGAVTFSPFGPDMTEWYGGVGVALSTSAFESFHFTLPDAAAHGIVPRSLAWAGADLLYPADWLAVDTAGLSRSILEVTADRNVWQAAADEARRVVAEDFHEEVVLERLAAVVLGDRETIRGNGDIR